MQEHAVGKRLEAAERDSQTLFTSFVEIRGLGNGHIQFTRFLLLHTTRYPRNILPRCQILATGGTCSHPSTPHRHTVRSKLAHLRGRSHWVTQSHWEVRRLEGLLPHLRQVHLHYGRIIGYWCTVAHPDILDVRPTEQDVVIHLILCSYGKLRLTIFRPKGTHCKAKVL